MVVKGVESESDSNSADGEGSEIETPTEEDVGEADEEKGSSGRASKSFNLIGPRISNVPTRYHGNHSYLKYVRSVLGKVRGGGGEGGGEQMVFQDWVPLTSDWENIPER